MPDGASSLFAPSDAFQCSSLRPYLKPSMATPTVSKQLSQIMRTEFERSLCLRNHLKNRRLFSSASFTRQRPSIFTSQSTTIQRISPTNSTAVTRRNPLPRLFDYADQRRSFVASANALAAIVTANPRTDEDGNEMLIDITERASTVSSLFTGNKSGDPSNATLSGSKRS